MSWIVDRIEGDLAVVLFNELTFEVPVAALPPGLVEGSRLSLGLEAPDTRAAAERMARLAAQHALPDVIDL
jgi:hypothetical protein